MSSECDSSVPKVRSGHSSRCVVRSLIYGIDREAALILSLDFRFEVRYSSDLAFKRIMVRVVRHSMVSILFFTVQCFA
jgi:hypothetical protein